jgi:hypothetical protein
MSTCLFTQFIWTILEKSGLSLLVGQACLNVCTEFDLKFFNGDLVISHDLEFFSKLDGLIEGDLLSFHFDFLGSGLDGLLKFRELFLVCI